MTKDQLRVEIQCMTHGHHSCNDLFEQIWQAAERQALERAAEMFDALGKELAALQVRALIEQPESKEKQHG